MTYTQFNLPRTVTTSSGVTSFEYDARGARVKKTEPDGSKTISLGGLYERRTVNGVATQVCYVQGAEGPVAQAMQVGAAAANRRVPAQGPARERRRGDQQRKQVIDWMYYEPFGARRSATSAAPPASVPEDVQLKLRGAPERR